MRRLSTRLCTGVAVALAAAFSSVAGDDAPSGFYPKEQAVSGTRAVARTVFRGEEIEEFPLEIIGRYRNYAGPGQDIILARLLGERTAFTGVVGGMSGSPVYVDGRLLGAISYRMGVFAKEPIAGITPIEEMIRAGEVPASPSAAWGRAPREPSDLVPIETPLLLGGFSREAVDAFSTRLRARGLEPVQSGTSGAGETPPGPLRPGSPIAVVLVQGDRSIAATGTLTHVDGNKLYAFGHPFLQAGTVQVPAARASILWTLSSWLGSNKIAAIGEPVGTIHEDRLTAVVGEIGPVPRMIPVTVEVDAGRAAPRRQRFEVARARGLVPLLLDFTIADTLLSSLDFSAESTVFVTASIDLPDHAPVRVEDAYAGDAAFPIAAVAAGRISSIVERIYDNPFRDADVRGVSVVIRQVPRVRSARVDRVVLVSDEIRPGTPFEVRVHLRNYRDEPLLETASILLPPTTLPGGAALVVGEGKEVHAAVPLLSGESRLRSARDYGSYMDRLCEQPRGGRLYLRLLRPARGAAVGSEILPDLPPSILSLFGARRGGDRPLLLQGAVLWERILDLPGPVSGLRSFPLRIGRARPSFSGEDARPDLEGGGASGE